MPKIKEIHEAKNLQKLNLQELPDGVVAFFVVEAESEFFEKQFALFEAQKEALQAQGISVLFVAEEEVEKEGLFVDPQKEIKNMVEELKDRDSGVDNLLIFTKKEDELTFSEKKEYPENEYNWANTFLEFAKNYNDPNEPEDSLWKWGQVVPEDGDYLCVDCGYIEEMKKGQTFPICIVCLSGEVDGPTGPEGGYWEKV